jgi:hypothetical protein
LQIEVLAVDRVRDSVILSDSYVGIGRKFDGEEAGVVIVVAAVAAPA